MREKKEELATKTELHYIVVLLISHEIKIQCSTLFKPIHSFRNMN